MLRKKLLKRFISDTKLGVSPIDDLKYWERVFKIFPGTEEKLTRFILELGEDPDGWINRFELLKGRIINEIKDNQAYKNFIASDMSSWSIENLGISSKSIYEISDKTDTSQDTYLSIDLKSANFQAIKEVGVYSDYSWSDFISKYTDSEHIKESKYFRSVIYGNLNVSRIQTVEKYLTNTVRKFLDTAGLLPSNYGLITMMPDELVYKVSGVFRPGFNTRSLEAAVEKETGVSTKIEHFSLRHQYLYSDTNPDRKIRFYSRENLENGEKELAGIGVPYAMVGNVLWKGMETCKYDYMFLNQEGYLCEIKEELKIKEGL